MPPHISCTARTVTRGGVTEGMGGKLKKENGKWDDEGREVIREDKEKERRGKGKNTVLKTFPCRDKK